MLFVYVTVTSLVLLCGQSTQLCTVLSCHCCRSSGLPQWKSLAFNKIPVRPLSSVGRSTSATTLPAGDLLLGSRQSGRCNDR